MLHTFQMILKRKGRRTEAAQGRKASLALFLVLLLILSSCNHHDSGHRKYYSAYDNVIDVKQDIREVPIEDVDISAWGKPYLLNDYLLLSDVMSYDKLIHIFDKNTFKYLTSVGNKGQGPGGDSQPGQYHSGRKGECLLRHRLWQSRSAELPDG